MEMKNKIEDKVLAKIHTGAVVKKPRWQFMAQVTLVAALALVAFLLSIFVLSFIIFSLHEGGEQFLLGFGGRGVLTLLALFPWFTLLLVIVLLVGLDWLVREFEFGYRTSILNIFAGAAALALLFGFIINLTPFHTYLLNRADRDELPLLGAAYKQVHEPHLERGVWRGYVTTVATSSLAITYNDRDRDTDEGSWTIIPPAGFDLNAIKIGDHILVAGEANRTIVRAYGLHKFPY